MKNGSSEEIDLFSIFQSIKRGVAGFLHPIGELIDFCFKNFKTLLLFCIIGVVIAVGLFFLKKKIYTSELTLTHNRLNNSECYSLLNDLTRLLENSSPENDKTLAKKLNISVNDVRQIKNITPKALNESLEKKYKDSASVILPFKVEARIYNPSILNDLQTGILSYLETNEYVFKRKEINRKHLELYEEKIRTEITGIDSLKQLVDKSIVPRAGGNGIILGEPIDPVKVYQAGLDLYKLQLRVDEQKQLNNSFEVMIDFSPAVPFSSLLYYILGGGLSSFFVGLLWLYSKKYRTNKEN